ncbi:MAG TPA: ferrochelatase [Candidatus Limnocylindrales bacterium]|nr:ferrochelatase [Candidatus Limnocylindrales bacterium]
MDARSGVLLMTYGSPESLEREDIRAYLARVRGGREPDDELVDEFTRRYRVIGGSPLIPITRELGDALSAALGRPVEIGMRFSEPSIETALRALRAAGAERIAAIILSPQYSPLLMAGYARAVETARDAIGSDAPDIVVAGAWHTEPAFIEALAERVRAGVTRAPADEPGSTHVLMTAHSLPRRVADQEPGYLEQLRATAESVASAAGLSPADWTFCWQSAGHEPGEWMKPDFADLMPEIAAAGGRSVLVVPVQFLADHLETLYDVDVGARDQAERHGLAFRRAASLNADPGLVDALAGVAHRSLSDASTETDSERERRSATGRAEVSTTAPAR